MMCKKHKIATVMITGLAVVFATAKPLKVAADTSSRDWPMWKYDVGHTAVTPLTLPKQLHLQWKRELVPPQLPYRPDGRQDDPRSTRARAESLEIPDSRGRGDAGVASLRRAHAAGCRIRRRPGRGGGHAGGSGVALGRAGTRFRNRGGGALPAAPSRLLGPGG